LCLSSDRLIIGRCTALESERLGFTSRLRVEIRTQGTEELSEMAALLSKPLLNLRVLENGYAKGCDNRYGDDDGWSVALVLLQ
jgi:hypothetical protein